MSSGSGGGTGGHIKQYSEQRLPSAIRELDPTCRQVYIMLRLRKTEQQIAGELGLGTDKTRAGIDEVRHCLGREGMLHLVEDPEMVPLYVETSNGPCISVPSRGIDLESRLIIREFIRTLRECLEHLPPHLAILMRLRYRDELTAREIVAFMARTGISAIQGKAPGEVTEQDIYYGLNIAFGMILGQLKTRYRGELGMGIGALKSILEEFEV